MGDTRCLPSEVLWFRRYCLPNVSWGPSYNSSDKVLLMKIYSESTTSKYNILIQVSIHMTINDITILLETINALQKRKKTREKYASQ